MPEKISPIHQEPNQETSPEIPVIAIDGINRSGKGTQIDYLKTALAELNINSIELRGDGTRGGLGLHEGDPLSPWWQEHSKKLRSEGTPHDWDYAAYRLTLEIKEWRERGAELGKQIALLDRSLLSRATFVIDRENPQTEILLLDDLYPVQPGVKLTENDILPDIIIELTAPKEVVLSRLDRDDPKWSFRSNLIEGCYKTFYEAKKRLPKHMQERIISIDSSQSPDNVFDDILESLNARMESWKNLNKGTNPI